MRNLCKNIAAYAADIAMIAGAGAIAVGTAMIYLPAGLIAAGTLAIVGAVLSNLGGDAK